jgi:hypothetical protein
MVTPSKTRIWESADVTSTSAGFPGANCMHPGQNHGKIIKHAMHLIKLKMLAD